MSTETHFLTISEASRYIEAGELSPVDLANAFLDRISAVDNHLHSFLMVTRDVALAEAEKEEQEIRAGRYLGPMHGIPFAVKDNINTSGIPTTGNSRLCLDNVPKEDAAVIERLRKSGAILLGKLALDEFAHGGPSDDLPWPPARNPWNVERSPGGSSSGSGAAVAAGLAMCALGTDTGGSVRSPSGLCGIVGLKPTYGRVSRFGIIPNSFSLDHCGPMTWTVEDTAHVLQAISGYDSRDPGSADVPVPDFAGALTKDIKGLKIGVVRHFYEDDLPASEEVRVAMKAALTTFADLGAEIEDARLHPLEDYAACKMIIQLAEIYAVFEEDLKARPEAFGKIFKYRVVPGALVRGVDYVQAQRQRRVLAAEYMRLLGHYDVLVTSGIYGPAPGITKFEPKAKFSKPSITVGFSVTAGPAVSLCNGFSEEGLPLAIQVAGKPFDEQTVLRVAHAYEQATPWRTRRPHLPTGEHAATVSGLAMSQ